MRCRFIGQGCRSGMDVSPSSSCSHLDSEARRSDSIWDRLSERIGQMSFHCAGIFSGTNPIIVMTAIERRKSSNGIGHCLWELTHLSARTGELSTCQALEPTS